MLAPCSSRESLGALWATAVSMRRRFNRDAIAELIEPLVINVTYVTLPCQRLEGLNRFPSFPSGSNLFDYP